MHLLAYHPERLATLRAALVAALAELRVTTCSLVEAAGANTAIRAMHRDLETMIVPAVVRILADAPLHRHSAGLDLGRLDQSLMRVMSAGYGWHLATDTRGDDPTAVSPAEARALGAALNHIDLTDLLADPVQLDWLALQLEVISADPTLTAAFLANFRHWARLCDAMGYARIELTMRADTIEPGDTDAVTRIDRVITALAATSARQLSQLPRNDDPTALIPQFGEMTPYAAALLARELPLQSHELAATAVALLTRWDNDRWEAVDATSPGPNTADLLFEVIACDQVAAAEFMVLAADRPSILFQSANDSRLARLVALIGTAPTAMPSARAGDVIIRMLSWFEMSAPYLSPAESTYPVGWELFLVDLITPWTLQLSPLNTEWDAAVAAAAALRASTGTGAGKAALLAFVLHHDGAIGRLADNGPALIHGVVTTLDHRNQRVIDELVAYLNMLSQLVVGRHVADAEAQHAAWSLMLEVISVVSTVATVPATPAVGFGVDAMVIGVSALVDQWIPDPGEVAALEQFRHEHRQAAVAGLLAAACFRALVSQGRLPRTTPPPPAADPEEANPIESYRKAFDLWLDTLYDAGFEAEGDLLADAVHDAASAAMAGEDAAT